MLNKIKAGAIGYLVLGLVFVGSILVAWTLIDETPFDAGSGDLTGPWVIAVLLSSAVAALAAGWVCRRIGGDQQSVLMLIAILVGLPLLVLLTGMLVGPTPTALAFVEELFGQTSADFPLSELLEGRPQTWVAVASYVLAILSIVVGASLGGKKGTGTSDNA